MTGEGMPARLGLPNAAVTTEILIRRPSGKYFRERSARLPATRFEEVVAGHVPQDDVPDVTNRILCEWIAST